MAQLILKNADGNKTFAMDEGKPMFAGRTVECDLYLPSPAVSRRHAVFLTRHGASGIKDLDSANGTFLNGKRLTRSERLKNGDIIQIGAFIIEFKADADTVKRNKKSKRLASRAERDTVRKMRKTIDLIEPAAPAESPPPALPEPIAEIAAAAEETPSLPPIEEPIDSPGPEPIPEPVPAPEPEPEPVAEPKPEPTPIPPPPTAKAEASARPPKIELVMPKRAAISDDEVGDGDDDDAFLIEDDAEGEDDGSGAAALAKAAAEAGIVGEFAPDTEDEGQGGGDAAPLPAAASGPMAFSQSLVQSADFAPGENAVPLDDDLRQTIEARLCLYSFLADLRQERDDMRARRPNLAEAVKSELARQDREMDKIPSAQQAEGMIEKRQAKKTALLAKIQEAKKNGTPPPPKPSRDMREAEEMAISQWTICAQSFSEALPAVYGEAFRLAENEPLAADLAEAGIASVPLMGGGVYYLALEYLMEEARYNRQLLRDRLASTPEPSEKKSPGGGMLGMFGRSRNNAADDEEDDGDAEEPINYEEMVANEKHLADRMNWIKQELAYIEKSLIQEFWKVYAGVALHYIPRHESMPLSIRAFLRHGAVGFQPWWMKPEVRDHIVEDCRDDVVQHMEVSRANTNILYADEYLAAVMNLECTPALDENLEINERNSPNWKADKALRKLINSRSQVTLMEELLDTLTSRIDGLEAEAAGVDQQIAKLLPGMKNYKGLKNELSQKRQTYRVEISKISKLATKIKEETLANLKETIAETEERFDSNELPKPTTEFLIKRECEALHKIGRLLANLKERFMPIVLRDYFQVGTDAVNDRPSINGEILEMERRDPGIFLENLVPSKKKSARVDLRTSPVIVLIPAAGVLAYSWNPRGKPEDGRLAIPTCFIRRRIRERQITYLLADFRWDTSKAAAGMDIMTSDTIVAAFMTVRWDWRKRSKEGREKGLIFTEQNDRTNWRRVYEAYSQTAYDSGKKLFNRNYDFYERIIGKYFDLPDGVPLLRK